MTHGQARSLWGTVLFCNLQLTVICAIVLANCFCEKDVCVFCTLIAWILCVGNLKLVL